MNRYVPGRPWQEALEEIIHSAASAAVLIGSDGLGPWEEPEMRACLSSFVERGMPVIPVLLPGAPLEPSLPLFLRAFTWVDFRDGLTEEGVNRLTWGITGSRPEPSYTPIPESQGGEGPPSRRSGCLLAFFTWIAGLFRWLFGNGTPYASDEEPASMESLPPRSDPDGGQDRAATAQEIVRTTEVFRTVGLPKYTYVEPFIYREITDAIETPGKHVLLEGPSGTGKTCLVRRVLEDLGLGQEKDFVWLWALETNCEEQALSVAESCKSGDRNGVVVIDDFHLLKLSIRQTLADHLKLISDRAFTSTDPATFVLIGNPKASEGFLFSALDLGPRIQVFTMPLASEAELLRLIREGEKRLSIRFARPHDIQAEANGSFFLCQYICQSICQKHGIAQTQELLDDLWYDIEDVRKFVVEQLSHRYRPLLVRLCSYRSPNVKTVNPFLVILRALGRISKQVVYLHEVIAEAAQDAAAVERVKGDIQSAIDNAESGGALRKLLHYDGPLEMFSIEDPAFRYFLDNLHHTDIFDIFGNGRRLRENAGDDKESDAERTEIRIYKHEVFLSYSHKDKEWLDRLQTMMSPLVRQQIISVWWDGEIKPSQKWRHEIDRALSQAKVGLLLVSPNFLSSDFISDHELPYLLDAAEKRGVKLVWVLVRNCLYDQTPLAEYQAANDTAKPLASLSEADLDDALVGICQWVVKALEEHTEITT